MSAASPDNVVILHPGQMGAAVGQCLTSAGHPALWAGRGRSPDTAARAAAAGLQDAGTVADAVARAGVVISVCPPHAALDVARQVRGFTGTYVDANAVAPATGADIAAIVEVAAPVMSTAASSARRRSRPGTTRLYLSGPGAGGSPGCSPAARSTPGWWTARSPPRRR